MINLEKIRKALALSILISGVFGCSSNGPDPVPVDDDKDRKAILTHWADNIIIPSYDDFKIQFDELVDQTEQFSASPDVNTLANLRLSWANAYIGWQHVELFGFGPADRYTIRNFYNIYPADVAGINANINDPASNLEVPASYARQGFPALDYLINGIAADDNAILEYYTTGPNAAKGLDYIQRIIGRMNSLLTDVIADWKGDYRNTFITETGLDIGSSMGLVVNSYVLHYERYIRSGKVGIPSGAAAGSTGTNPDKVEAFYKKDLSKALLENAHNAVVGFFNGVDVSTDVPGPSFKSYLDALGAKDMTSGTALSQIINDQFTVVEGKIDALLPSLYEQIQSSNQPMVDTYTELQKAVRMLKVDMTSAMSITITYTDNDGD